MRRLLLTILAAAFALVTAAPVRAETPTDVVEQATDGVFIAPSVEGFEAAPLAEAVAEARRQGIKMIVVAPADPVPTAEAFALRVRQAGEYDVALVFAADGVIQASVSEDFVNREVPALDAARPAGEPGAAASAYLEALVAERDDSVPGTVRRIITIVILLVVVLIAATVAEQFLGRSRRHESEDEPQEMSA